MFFPVSCTVSRLSFKALAKLFPFTVLQFPDLENVDEQGIYFKVVRFNENIKMILLYSTLYRQTSSNLTVMV